MSGTPTLLYLVTLAGGAGGILAIANVAPERCVAVTRLQRRARVGSAAELFAPLVPLLGAHPLGRPVTDRHARRGSRALSGIGTATRRPLAPVADDTGIRASARRRLLL